MASVIIHGFENDESAKEFINWFSEQGEQDQTVWFEIRSEENPEIKQHDVDSGKCWPWKQDADGNWILIVKP